MDSNESAIAGCQDIWKAGEPFELAILSTRLQLSCVNEIYTDHCGEGEGVVFTTTHGQAVDNQLQHSKMIQVSRARRARHFRVV